MDLGKVIGKVIATQKVSAFEGMKLSVVQPLDEFLHPTGSPIICSDHTSQADDGEIVFFVTSGDATQAAPDIDTPSDAAIVGIVDTVDAPHSLHLQIPQQNAIPITFQEKVYQKKK